MADFASSLPTRTEINNSTSDMQISIADGTTNTQLWEIDANGVGQVNLTDGTNDLVINSDGTIGVGDGTEQLLINTDGSISTQLTDGTDALNINSDGSLNVVVSNSTAGDEIHEYATSATVAAGNTVTVITYTVTALKTLLLKTVEAAASGKAKVVVLAGTPSSETVRAVFFISTASGFGQIHFDQPIEVAAGDNVLVTMTNNDNQSQDLYAFINGSEV